MSGTIDKIKAKVDNVLHKDKTHDTTTGTHGHTGTHGTTHNDPTGPHSSHIANKADPKVDSDHVGTVGNTSGAGGVGAGQYGSSTGTHTGTHGTTGGLTGTHGNTHTTEGSAGGLGQKHATSHGDPSGPHASKLANKLDPTVDTPSYGTADPHTGHYTNTHGTTGSGVTGTHGTTGHSDPTGPHNSHLMNKVDLRVDSDQYGTAGNTAGAGGHGAGQYGTTGTHGSSGLTGSHGTTGHSDPTGPHNSHLMNEADPRVDSDRIGTAGNTAGAGGHGAGQYGTTGTHTGGTVGSGNSSSTAGPHNSNLLNKVDPRVDSDLDGSKTVGGNQTYH